MLYVYFGIDIKIEGQGLKRTRKKEYVNTNFESLKPIKLKIEKMKILSILYR